MLSKREFAMLKYLREEHSGVEIASRFSPNAVQTATDLVESGLAYMFKGSDASFRINAAGQNAMRDYKVERRRRFVSVWLAPIIVTVIAACILLALRLG